MQELRQLRVVTTCDSCQSKCCSEPYDWVYLTQREIRGIEELSGVRASEFVVTRQNEHTGHVFRALELPCRFFDQKTGQCSVYARRPVVCQLFPFYPDPLTGHAMLITSQCGDNLELLPPNTTRGWSLQDLQSLTQRWLSELWDEARSITRETTS